MSRFPFLHSSNMANFRFSRGDTINWFKIQWTVCEETHQPLHEIAYCAIQMLTCYLITWTVFISLLKFTISIVSHSWHFHRPSVLSREITVLLTPWFNTARWFLAQEHVCGTKTPGHYKKNDSMSLRKLAVNVIMCICTKLMPFIHCKKNRLLLGPTH